MILHVIKTGSKGNCYLIEVDGKFLILDAGASIKEIQKYFYENKLAFSLKNVLGCIITHEHGDHAKYIDNFRNNGIEVYSSHGTFEAIYEDNYIPITNVIQKNKPFEIGDFFCIAVTSYHDANEPLNFIIHIKGENIVYITDTGYINFNFDFKVSMLICEINHSNELIEDNFVIGKLNSVLYDRVRKNHLSKEQVFTLLEKNQGKINQLIAVHLSENNINKKGLASEIIKEFGVLTNIATNNSNFYF